ncbi:hypothetical protein D3C87_07940 [compost metagenome]
MFVSYIRKAKRLNRMNFDSFTGKRVYYCKVKNTISLVVKVLFLLGFVALNLFTASKNDLQILILLSILVGLFLLDSIFESIGRLLLKNPVFVLKGEGLYYIHTNEWYDIRNYEFRDENIGKHNYYETYCMFDEKGTRILKEKNWHLKDEEVFKSHVKYNQRILENNR